MALQDYATLQVFVNGNALQQVTSAEMVANSGQVRVDLLNEGMSGFSPGSGDREVNVGFVVPIGGPEEDYMGMSDRGEYVQMQVFQGTDQYVGNGKFQNVRISRSVNQTLEGTFSWLGEPGT